MFRILHLSDLHIRKKESWSSLPLLREAKETLLAATSDAAIDVVAFTGDIAYSGKREEFDLAERWLAEVTLSSNGLNLDSSRLLFVPGNHDVDRDAIGKPGLALQRMLRDAGRQSEVADIYEDAGSRDLLLGRLSEYYSFLRRMTGDGADTGLGWTRTFDRGLGVISFEGFSSSWLCSGDADHRHLLVGQPQVTSRQEERGSSDVRIAMMHHPLSDLMEFDERFCRSHFRTHHHVVLRGHLHDADVVSHAAGTGSFVEVAAGSLHEAGSHANRFNIIDIDDEFTELSVVTYLWQSERWIRDRNAFPSQPDGVGRFKLLNKSSDRTSSRSSTSAGSSQLPAAAVNVMVDASSVTEAPPAAVSQRVEEVLKRFPAFSRVASRADLAVRQRQLEQAVSIADDKRLLVIETEWGANAHSFVSAIVHRLRERPGQLHVMHARCGTVADSKQLQELLSQYVGATAMEFASVIRQAGRVVVVFDELEFDDRSSAGSASIADAIRALVDYIPNLVACVVTSGTGVVEDRGNFVVLKPFDVADIRAYLENHSAGPIRLDKVVDYDRIQRATTGVPRHIDAVVNALQYTDLDGALSVVGDDGTVPEDELPSTVVDSISRLASEADSSSVRAYSLLTVLSVLDHGETLKTIQRVEPQSPFWAQQARQLQDLGLLDVVDYDVSIAYTSRFIVVGRPEKILRVPRLVRDYVRSIIPESERTRILLAAASVYFGSDWKRGNARPRTRPEHLGHYRAISVGNELTIVQLLLRGSSRGEPDSRPCTREQAARLALQYASFLNSKGLYGEAYEVASESVGIMDGNAQFDELKEISSELRLIAGKCARMTGDRVEAVRALSAALPVARASGVRDRIVEILIELAMSYESLGNEHEAKKTAEEVIKLSAKDSSQQLQAKAVIAGFIVDDRLAVKNLKMLQGRANNLSYHVIADNIAIEIARRVSDTEQILKQLASVRARRVREYNYIRATVRRVDTLMAQGRYSMLTAVDDHDIRWCYTMAFAQRLQGLFEQCHGVFWRYLESRKEFDRQLELFMHSSFFWRLHGDWSNELIYAKKILSRGSSLPTGGVSEYVYRYCEYRVRSAIAKVEGEGAYSAGRHGD